MPDAGPDHDAAPPPDRATALAQVRGADAPAEPDGVPMVLALVDMTRTAVAPVTPGAGPAVARRLQDLTEVLAPDAADTDQRTLHLLLATASVTGPPVVAGAAVAGPAAP